MEKSSHDSTDPDEFLKSRCKYYIQAYTRHAESEDKNPRLKASSLLMADLWRYLGGDESISHAAFKEKVAEVNRLSRS